MRQALARSVRRRIYDNIARRYDIQHAVITAGADRRGRRLLVAAAVRTDDLVLDAGGGTGSTALLAADTAGGSGRVIVLDLSRGMLAVARRRVAAAGLSALVAFVVAEVEHPPFRAASFDVALSTYSLCPLTDPVDGAGALYGVVRPGGCFGAAHSAEPRGALMRWLARRVESAAWRFPWLSMGCRPVSVLPSLRARGATVKLDRHIGVPLWPFDVFVVEKSATLS